MILKIVIGGLHLDKLLYLSKQVQAVWSRIKVVCVSDSMKVLHKELTENPPDILIIERYLSDGTASRLLDSFNYDERAFHVIFYTNEFGDLPSDYRKMRAIYCLYYPFSVDEFNEAIDMVCAAGMPNDPDTVIEKNEDNSKKFIEVRVSNELIYIDQNDIIYIEADRNYSKFVLKQNTLPLITAKTLKTIIPLLNNNFIRIHKSFIININYYKMIINKNRACYIVMKNNKHLHVSRERKEEVMNFIEERNNTTFNI